LGLDERWGVPSTISPGFGSIGWLLNTINLGIVEMFYGKWSENIFTFHFIAD
jgi:hypothetical protein